MIKRSLKLYPVTLCIIGILAACHSVPKSRPAIDNEELNMHSAYDDSTLSRNILPVLMPYNRIIDPAGKVVSFGDPDEENHSMDVRLVPGTKLIAIEDRSGIALIDTVKCKVVTHWTYKDNPAYRGLSSTYSGLKVLN